MTVFASEEAFKREAYEYFNDNVRPIETYIENGVMRVRNEGHNDDIDAFRHAYVSARFAKENGDNFANAMGLANEAVHWNNSSERSIDLWNNSVGRQCGIDAASVGDIGGLVKQALDRGGLIIDIYDNRIIPDDSDRVEVYQDALQELSAQEVKDIMDYCKDLLDDYVDDAQTVGDYLLSSLESLYNSALIRRVDPLTLDLDGDGVELVNVNNSTAFFDLDVLANADGTYTSDGVKEQVGWVKGDDGLLVLDKNGNGTVDNILELFGKTDKTGTEELREYDLNGDGKIDSNDTIFSQLKVWQDTNQNGISESSELKSLSDLNITSINVSPESLTTINQESNGNTILSQGTYTTADGVERNYANLDLAVNQTNSTSYEYTDSDGNTTGDYELNLEVLNLPFIRGYGDVKALPIAACNDATLLNLLTELRDLDSANYKNISSLVEQIIFQWTGASEIDSTAMRGSFSAQKLAAMEAIGGQDYYSTQTQSNDVASWQVDSVNSAWTQFFNDIKEKLLIQSTFKEIFSYTVTTEIPESTETVTNEDGSTTEVITPAYTTTETIYPIYDFATDSINFSDLTADQVFANIATKLTDGSIESTVSDAADPTVAAELNAIYTYAEKATFVKQIQGILNSIPTEINGLSSEVIATNISSINTTYLNKVVAGASSSDFVADIHVNEANDTIIIGNQGDDILHGYKGNDTYVFNIGDGKDSIDESGRSGNFVNDEQNTDYGTDTILMGAGITKDDVYISGNASQMVIKFKSTNSDQITINSQNYTAGKVETILFSNGDIIDLTDPDLKYNFYGTNSNDTLNGSNDADILSGEQGNDILQGANGNDTYIFNRGDRQDIIAEYGVLRNSTTGAALNADTNKYDTGYITYAGSDASIPLGTDTIQFEAGITESDLTFFINGSDLHIGISDSPSDLIIIKDHFNGVANRIENLKFTNEAGETTILDLTTKDWLTMTLTTTGTPQDDVINASLGDDVIYSEGGNDTINAGLGNDLLNGGTGNDALNGGEGSDIYEFNLGDGEDTITDSASGDDENKIIFGIGISASNLVFTRGSGTGSNNDLIVTFTNSPDDKITIKNFVYSESSLKYFEFTIDNGDGTTSTTQVEAKSLIAGFTYSGTEGADIVNSTNNASNYNDTVNLLGGNDTAYTQAGNDMLIGGTGNDYLAGGRGNDTYVFNAGDGEDSISEIGYSDNLILESYEDNGSDTIQLGAGITKDDLIFAVEQGNLVITFKNSIADKITIYNHVYGTAGRIETLKFADGSTLDLTDLNAFSISLNGTSGNDTITGTLYSDAINALEGDDNISGGEANDTINGGAGNDRIDGGNGDDAMYGNDGDDFIVGNGGNDIIAGGAGNDTMSGFSTGDDTYLFSKGDGQDIIFESTSHDGRDFGYDRIKFDETISKDEVIFSTDGSDLVIKFDNGTTDQITIKYQFAATSDRIEIFEFVDGSTLDISDVNNLLFKSVGSSGNDVITASNYDDEIDGGAGNDTINAMAGDDVITGGAGDDILGSNDYNWGNDTYIFNIGDGKDTIAEAPSNLTNYNLNIGSDTISFGEGIVRTKVVFTVSGNDLIIGFRNTAADQITVKNQFRSTADKVETIKFVDGSTVDISGLTSSNYASYNLSEAQTYSYNLGDGEISIYETSTHEDKVVFGSGISASNIHFTRSGNDLEIRFNGNDSDKITILNQYLASSDKIETLEFTDGSTFDISTPASLPLSIYGTNSAESISGTSGADYIDGQAGNDIIAGGAGSDTYFFNFGDGQDVITDYDGVLDKIIFGSGIAASDVYFTRSSNYFDNNLYINFRNNSADKITVQYYYSGTQFKLEQMEFADGSTKNFSDIRLEYVGTEDNDYISGSNFNDDIYGGAGNDTIETNNGDDVVYGGSGNDFIASLDGASALYGEDGDDTIYAGLWSSGTYNNYVDGGAGEDYLGGGNGDDTFFGGTGNDQIYSHAGNDIVDGGAGNDIIYTEDGNDIIAGGEGNDDIHGGNGDDVIDGGAGNDLIYGDAGNNILTGGAGADSFVITNDAETNTITDFELGIDTIDLRQLSDSQLFSQLNVYQDGANAVIEILGKQIVFENIDVSQLNESNFKGLLKEGGYTINGSKFSDDLDASDYYSQISDLLNKDTMKIYGNAGDDKISNFGGNNDILDGGAGDDILTISKGSNTLTGGSGADKFSFSFRDVYESGDSNNVITDFDVSEKIILDGVSNLTFADLTIVDGPNGAVITHVANGNYASVNNTITLNGISASQLSADNFVIKNSVNLTWGDDLATLGDDGYYINSNGGNDNITSGSGDDYVTLGSGSSIVNTGAGDDKLYFSNSNNIDGNNLIYTGEGDDFVSAWDPIATNLNQIFTEGGNDKIEIYGEAQYKIAAGEGKDLVNIQANLSQIYGDEGDDKINIISGSGNEIFAGVGDDIANIYADASNTRITGGAGDDLFVIRKDYYSATSVGSNVNTIADFEIANTNEKIDLQFMDIAGFSDLQISQDGTNAVIAIGNDGKTIILENTDASQLTADNFAFKIVGTSAGDVISGENKINVIRGAEGNDVISASGAENYFSGNDGNDIFLIEQNANSVTTITDFEVTNHEEKIRIKGFAEIASFDDLYIAYEFDYNSNKYNASINMGNGQTIVVSGIDRDSLTANNFKFNTAPVSANDNFSTNEDNSVEIKYADIFANDYDNESDFVITNINAPAHGTIVENADGSGIIYTPNANYHGTDSITYQIKDEENYLSAVATITLDIASVNDAPTVANIVLNQTTAEDATFNFALPSNVFTDIDGDDLTITATLADGSALPSWLSFDGAAFSGIPLNEDVGSLALKLTATDETGAAVTTEFTLEVTNTNDAPTATNITTSTVEDNSITLDVLAGVVDVDGDVVSISATTSSSHGTVEIITDNGVQKIKYTPNANYNGADSFTVTIIDGNGGAVERVVNVTTSAVNDAPIVANIVSSTTTAEDAAFEFTLPSNVFSDVDGDVLTITATLADGSALPSWLTFNGSKFSGTPLNENVGSLALKLTATDTTGATVTTGFTLAVTNTNDAPTAANISTSTIEDNSVIIDVLTDVVDVDGDVVSISAISDSDHGTVEIITDNGVQKIKYTPNANYNGADSFAVTIADGNGGKVVRTIDVATSAVNDVPTVANIIDTQNTAEDASFEFILPSNVFSDVDGDVLTITATLTNGSALPSWLSFDGVKFSGTPLNENVGTLVLKLTATDISGTLVTTEFTLQVTNTNDAPTATNITTSTVEDHSIILDVLAGVVDVDGDVVSISSVTASDHGTVEIITDNGIQKVKYTPNANYNGTDSFSVTIVDGNSGAVTRVVNITTSEVNDPPIVANIIDNQTTAEDAAFEFTLPSDVFSDVDGDDLTITATLADGSALPSWLSFDGVKFSGTPLNENVGSLVLKLTATDASGASAQTEFTLAVTNTNDAPTASNITTSTVEDNSVILDVLSGVVDVDGDTVSISSFTSSSHGNVEIITDLDGVQKVKYTPAANYSGADSFNVIISDGNGGTITRVVNVTTSAVNDAPIVANIIDTQTTAEDAAFEFTLPSDVFRDVDGDVLTIIATLTNGSPLPSWLSFDGVKFSGTPLNENVGSLILRLTATDALGTLATTEFTLQVTNTNDAPTASNITTSTVEDNSVILDVLSGVVDVDGDTLAISSIANSSNGTAEIITENGVQKVKYTPNANYNGNDSLSVTITDGKGGTVTREIAVTISAANDAPILANIIPTQVAKEGDPFSFTIPSGTFSDVDGDSLTYSFAMDIGSTLPAWLYFDGTTFSGTPANGDHGNLSIIVTAKDSSGASVSTKFTLQVDDTNYGPTAANLSVTTIEDNSVIIDALFGAVDSDGDTLSISSATSSSHGTVEIITDNGVQKIKYTPNANYNGADSFTVTIIDGNGGAVERVVNVTTSAVNDAPIVANIVSSTTTAEDAAFEFTLPSNVFSDVDGDVLTITATLADGSALPSWLTFNGSKFSGTPLNENVGSLSLKLIATDPTGAVVTTSFTLQVTNTNDAPTATSITTSTIEDNSVILDVLSNVSDVDGDVVSISSVTASNHGTVEIVADNGIQKVKYSPNANYNGSDSFSVVISDGNGGTVTRVVNIATSAVNDAPIVANIISSKTTAEDAAFEFTLPSNVFSDVDGDVLTITATLADGSALPSWLSFNGAKFTGTPLNENVGSLSLKLTATDTSGAAVTTAFTLQVTNTNDAPIVGVSLVAGTTEDNSVTIDALAGVVDDDGDVVSIYAVTSSHGTTEIITEDGRQKIKYTPNANYNGSDSVLVTISDGNGGTLTRAIPVTISAVNDAPTAATLAGSTSEDNSVIIDALNGATDVDGDTLSISSATSSSHGTVEIITDNGVQKIKYTPNTNYNGADSFAVTISDGHGGTVVRTINIATSAVNDAPIVANIISSKTTAEDAAFEFTLPSNVFSDVDGDVLTITATLADGSALPSWLSFNGAKFTGTPLNENVGSLSLKLTATDPTGAAVATVFTLQVTNTNDAPTASAISVSTTEDNSVIIAALTGAVDVDGDTLSISSVTTSAHGTVEIITDNGVQKVKYTPNANYNGSDSFSVVISDGNGGTVSRVVNVATAAVNDAPVGADIPTQTLAEDTSLTFNLLANVSDIDGDSLLVTLLTNPANGSVVLNNGVVTYTPNRDYNGVDSFQYKISDGNGGILLKTMNFNVTAVNDAPVVANIVPAQAVAEDSLFNFTLPNNVFSDVDGDVFTITATLADGSALPSWLSFDGTKFSGTPLNVNVGNLALKLTATDGAQLSATTQFTLQVTNTNDAPVATDSTSQAMEDGNVTILLSSLVHDVDGDNLAITLFSPATNGTVTVSNGIATYTPNTNYNGADSFQYKVDDGNGGIAIKTIYLNITAVNDAPTAITVSTNNIAENLLGAVVGTLSTTDVDANESFTYSVNDSRFEVINGNQLKLKDGVSVNFEQESAINLQVTTTDFAGASVVKTITVNVTNANEAPFAAAVSSQINEDNSIIIDVLATATDVDAGDVLSIASALSASHGTVEIITDNGKQKIKYTPNANYNGTDTFTYQISDAAGVLSNVATVNLTIAAVNDAPTVVNTISTQTAKEGSAFSYTVPGNIFADVDSSLSLSCTLANGAAIPSWLHFDGSAFSGTPVDGDAGDLSITLTALDSQGVSVSQTFTISIANTIINGGATSENLNGTLNNDTISGNDGDDVIWAFDGNDTITGGTGVDTIYGGLGDDMIQGDDGNDVLYGNGGNDTIYGNLGNDAMRGHSGDDSLFGSNGNDYILGDDGNDTLMGDNGIDEIHGGTGNDSIFGGAHDDSLYGDEGSDTILGGDGYDYIEGGEGNDIMTGGKGNDIFSFTSLEESTINSSDLITDFTKGQDKIDFSALNFTGITSDESQTDGAILTYHFEGNRTVIENEDHSFVLKLDGKIDLTGTDFNF